MKLELTQDWSSARHAWPQTLSRLRGQGGRAFEVGSFEGASAVWLCDWLGPHGHVTCVEDFSGRGQPWTGEIDMAGVEARFERNTSLLRRDGRLTLWRQPSFLAWADAHEAYYDVVYVDGSHDPAPAFMDSMQALRACAPGGFVLIDDYRHPDLPDLRASLELVRATAVAEGWHVVNDDYQLHLHRPSRWP